MKAVIIDVRTPKEFNEGSYPCALNIPSNDFNVSDYNAYRDYTICLVCFSGNRASKVKAMLENEGFTNIAVMENQMAHILEGEKSSKTTWTVDRQFRLALGVLLGIFLIGNYIFNTPASLAILLVVFSGLIYSAISDNCYLKMFIASLPWNKKVKISLSEVNANLA